MSMSSPKYDVARGAASGAAAAIFTTCLLWLTTTKEPFSIRIGIGLVVGIVTLGVLPVVLELISRIEDRNLQAMLANRSVRLMDVQELVK